jgi:periplasmic protein TonB
MFADTLDSSWDERSRRGWTTLTSFGLQVLVVGLLLLIPLLRPEGLPLLRKITTPISAGRLPAEPPAVASRPQPTTAVQSNFRSNRLMTPSRIPSEVVHITDVVPPPQTGPIGPYIPGLRGIGDPNGVFGSVREGVRPVMPAPPPVATRTIRISHMSEGNLVYKVQPVYPSIARTAGIEGQVVLEAVISREGTIENLHVVAGHPMLVRAAIDAVSQWRYRPYLLNNEPVEVETQITVNFMLSRN